MTQEEYERIRRNGAYAQNLLDDAIFLDVLKGLKEHAIFSWTNAKSPNDREDCWRDLQAVGRLKITLESLVQTWHAEVDRLERAEQQKKQTDKWREQQEAARG